MSQHLHVDIETYSSVDIRKSGAYKYIESPDFEILLIGYAFDDLSVKIIDLARGEEIPDSFKEALLDSRVIKHAHNATFERVAFSHYGLHTTPDQWACSLVKSAYCGLPLNLEMVSKALQLGEDGKLGTGKALINYFTKPCKATKTNGGRTRNLPEDDPEKWEEFKRYCKNDVIAERKIDKTLARYEIPELEKVNYLIDQQINDRGIKIDLRLANAASRINTKFTDLTSQRVRELTGVDNPNSAAQLKDWLSNVIGDKITSLAKDELPEILKKTEAPDVREVIECRAKISKSSVKKYEAMLNSTCADGRAHGLFQFYGANRTGRWAGRIIQLHNLPRNYMKDLALARELVLLEDFDLLSMAYDNIANVLSELIRTALVPKEGHTFAVADFSAIEARVLSWLAGEKWRLKVFKGHGKIYEASAALMFNVPIEEVTKGSDYRAKGKIAELALGYQGSVGAMKAMGGEGMGLSEPEMLSIVSKWRTRNPSIVAFWQLIQRAAIGAIERPNTTIKLKGLRLHYDRRSLIITLPSGRSLYYYKPQLAKNKFGSYGIKYQGVKDGSKAWGWIDTYGGKLTENVVQAIARDLLAVAMYNVWEAGIDIVLHVHDEIACEIPTSNAKNTLNLLYDLMCKPVAWAPGLPLGADGYLTQFYKKD